MWQGAPSPVKETVSKTKFQPVHRVTESNIALKPCPSDPFGIRAREDFVRCETDPVHHLRGEAQEQFAKEMTRSFDKVEEDVKTLHEVLVYSKVQGYGKDDVAMKKAEEKILTHLQEIGEHELHDDVKKRNQTSTWTDDKMAFAAHFFILVDMYCELAKNPFIRRAATYKRRVTDMKEAWKTSRLCQAWYVTFPCVLFFFAFGFQSFMLHISTHFYVRYMDLGPPERRADGGQLFDLGGQFVAKFFTEHQGDVDDQGAVIEGHVHIPMILLDASGGIPLMLCAAAYFVSWWKHKFNIGLWNKTFIVASCMAVLKGIFDAVTILPDSIGWGECKERLQETGLKQMRELHFFQDFWTTLFEAMTNEVLGGSNGRRVRYCADMMISGHTYFAALFAMSAYKQVDVADYDWRVRRIVWLLCVGCITTELLLVAAARFHYTVDTLSSLVLVLLLWDSSYVEQVAADWSEGFDWRDPKAFKSKSTVYQVLSTGQDDTPEVLPSQASHVVNMRLLAGQPPWATIDDGITKMGNNEAAEPLLEGQA